MRWTRSTIATTALVLAVILFFAANIASNIFFRSGRLDLTEGGLYTVSPGTINTLRSIPEPVTLRFFFSERLAARYVGVRAYGQRVRDLLQEYAAIANGKVNLEVVDPEPLTEQEDAAVAEGVTGAQIPGGDTLYFGLVGTNMVGGREVIPIFAQDRERYLEYDLTNLVYKLIREKKPKIGIVTNLPLDTGLGGMQAALQGQSRSFMIYEMMQGSFDLKFLEQDFDRVPADIDVVMIAHPKPLNQRTLYALDQFVMRGGRIFAALDPVSDIAKQEANPMGGPPEGPTVSSAANIEPLMKSWGVRIDPKYVVGDDQRALPVSIGGAETRYLAWLGLTREEIDPSDLVTANISSINLGTAGAITVLGNDKSEKDKPKTEVTPLLRSTPYSMQIEAARVQMQPDPDELLRAFAPSNERYVIAARITGPVKSAFPDGPPPATPPQPGAPKPEPLPAHLKESNAPANIILIADSDIFDDNFWVQAQDMMGQRVAMPFAGNSDFVLNAIENLSGSSDLLSLRARGTSNRPFDVVNDIRSKAERRFLAEEQTLQNKLTQTQNRISELQGARKGQGQEILSPQQQAEIEKFRAELIETRAALRDVQHRLRSDIDRLGSLLAAINILFVPLMLSGAAIGLAVMRRRTVKPKAEAPAAEEAAA